jgi:hypothetical protein
MTANKNEPEKKPAGSTSAQPGARPHATLDLKATELTPPGDTAKDKSGVAEASKSDSSKVKADAPASASASAASSAAGAKATTGATTDKPSPPPAAKPSAAARPAARGYGGFFTHIAAGLVGGIIALLAADIFAGQLGFETGDQPDKTTALEKRLAALEANRNPRTIPPDLAQRLSASDAKLAQLEQLAANVEGVSKKQANFDKNLNELNAKISAAPADSPSAERVAKLEEQLQLMQTAAKNDPQSGRLPQLAAITGKLADLEATLSTQLDAVRQNVAQQIDTRLATATEAGQAARSGTQRIDREVATLKAETAEMSSGLTSLKTDSDRASAALKTTQEDLKRLKSDVDTRLAAVARPEDVSSAVNPLNDKLAALQQDVQGVIKSEGDRRTTAERIVLSLELANLKRAIERGGPYAPELAQTRKVAGSVVDLGPLERYALDGVPTSIELQQAFKPVAFKIIDADQQPQQASIVDRLLSGAKSVVRVRKTAHNAEDKSVEATVARMEDALKEDRFSDVLTQAKALPAPAREAAQDFIAKVEAREAVDRALASVETQLKSSLAAAPADDPGNAAQ